MKLAKLVDVVARPEGGTTTYCRGWYLVENGECVRVELWNVYTRRKMENEKDQKEEDARIAKKQKNNWRKLELMPYVICEGKEELFELIKQDKKDEEKIKHALHEYNAVCQGGGIDD